MRCRQGWGVALAPLALLFPRSLDSDQKDQLIEVIEKLLADKTTVSRAPGPPAPKSGDMTMPPDLAPSWECSHPCRCHHPH